MKGDYEKTEQFPMTGGSQVAGTLPEFSPLAEPGAAQVTSQSCSVTTSGVGPQHWNSSGRR